MRPRKSPPCPKSPKIHSQKCRALDVFSARECGEFRSQGGNGELCKHAGIREAERAVQRLWWCLLCPQFSSLQKEIEERTNDIESLKGEQVKLQGVIKSLEKDILGLKREIQERDETIQDKVKAHLCPPSTT